MIFLRFRSNGGKREVSLKCESRARGGTGLFWHNCVRTNKLSAILSEDGHLCLMGLGKTPRKKFEKPPVKCMVGQVHLMLQSGKEKKTNIMARNKVCSLSIKSSYLTLPFLQTLNLPRHYRLHHHIQYLNRVISFINQEFPSKLEIWIYQRPYRTGAVAVGVRLLFTVGCRAVRTLCSLLLLVDQEG